MTTNRKVTLYHSPNTRSAGVLLLLKELGADFDLHVIDMTANEQRGAEFMAINPMGKVPAVVHGDALVTEQVAIYLYLADLYPEAGLAPPVGDPLRGPYLRWMAFYGSSFEPAMIDRALKREAGSMGMSPYGDADLVLKTVNEQLARNEYMLGGKPYAVDVLWGAALTWMVGFGLVPPTPVVQNYLARVNARPAVAWAKAKDAELVAARTSTTG